MINLLKALRFLDRNWDDLEALIPDCRLLSYKIHEMEQRLAILNGISHKYPSNIINTLSHECDKKRQEARSAGYEYYGSIPEHYQEIWIKKDEKTL